MRLRRDAKLGVISATPLFAGCSKQELRDVAAACRETSLPAGETVIREGERGHEFFVVLDGTVEVLQQGERIGELGAGEWVGEVALISDVPRTATVVTTSPVRLFVLTDQSFQQLLNDVPSIAEKVQASFRERQRPPVHHVITAIFATPDGRRWSAIGGGDTAEDAIRFARDCLPEGHDWELVGSTALHGD
jgi:signal-transduction protein with cAMP-binding, CBS, and nucleotidyltransferase domain